MPGTYSDEVEEDFNEEEIEDTSEEVEDVENEEDEDEDEDEDEESSDEGEQPGAPSQEVVNAPSETDKVIQNLQQLTSTLRRQMSLANKSGDENHQKKVEITKSRIRSALEKIDPEAFDNSTSMHDFAKATAEETESLQTELQRMKMVQESLIAEQEALQSMRLSSEFDQTYPELKGRFKEFLDVASSYATELIGEKNDSNEEAWNRIANKTYKGLIEIEKENSQKEPPKQVEVKPKKKAKAKYPSKKPASPSPVGKLSQEKVEKRKSAPEDYLMDLVPIL